MLNALWVFLSAVAIAIIAPWISRSIKISEFRQIWINELRKDLAEYTGIADQWFRKWDEINDLTSVEKERRERSELYPLANAARVKLRTIRLRFSPRSDNTHKAEEDAFLQGLADLLNPGKLTEDNAEASWQTLADKSVEQGREILKRAWQETKALMMPRPFGWTWDKIAQLSQPVLKPDFRRWMTGEK